VVAIRTRRRFSQWSEHIARENDSILPQLSPALPQFIEAIARSASPELPPYHFAISVPRGKFPSRNYRYDVDKMAARTFLYFAAISLVEIPERHTETAIASFSVSALPRLLAEMNAGFSGHTSFGFSSAAGLLVETRRDSTENNSRSMKQAVGDAFCGKTGQFTIYRSFTSLSRHHYQLCRCSLFDTSHTRSIIPRRSVDAGERLRSRY